MIPDFGKSVPRIRVAFLLHLSPETCQFPMRNDAGSPFFGGRGGFRVGFYDVSRQSEVGGIWH